MNIILFSILVLCGLGIFFGLVLAYAAKKFYVPVNATVERILSFLPGANCGACGKAGCRGFAQALLRGEMDLSSCAALAKENRKAIADILGLNLSEKEKLVSSLHCCGGHHAKDRFIYEGIEDCIAASLTLGGQKECRYGCLTFGTCVGACPFGAIVMTGEGHPKVIEEKCTACGVCVQACPKNLYTLIPFEIKRAPIYVACSSLDSGKTVLIVCGLGCIACRKCEKACPKGCMKVIDNLARIDYAICDGCAECAKVCPTKVIKVRNVESSTSKGETRR